ncbi:hypothetical protein ZWY2020_029556 [Hordeum vulgare]|nr:hypothetical protein ZWY2020_029556 [Hordeum vulgare]
MVRLPYMTALTTPFSYDLLFAYGHFSDFFRRILDASKSSNLKGYEPICLGYEDFYRCHLYLRIQALQIIYLLEQTLVIEFLKNTTPPQDYGPTVDALQHFRLSHNTSASTTPPAPPTSVVSHHSFLSAVMQVLHSNSGSIDERCVATLEVVEERRVAATATIDDCFIVAPMDAKERRVATPATVDDYRFAVPVDIEERRVVDGIDESCISKIEIFSPHCIEALSWCMHHHACCFFTLCHWRDMRMHGSTRVHCIAAPFSSQDPWGHGSTHDAFPNSDLQQGSLR